MTSSPQAQQTVISDTLARVAALKGVVGYMVVHPKDGSVLQHAGFDGNKRMMLSYAEKLHAFISVTQSMVRLLDHNDDLTFLRMRWRQREIILAPDLNREYLLIVVHDHQGAQAADGGAATGVAMAEAAVHESSN
jgi:hypothetical protein